MNPYEYWPAMAVPIVIMVVAQVFEKGMFRVAHYQTYTHSCGVVHSSCVSLTLYLFTIQITIRLLLTRSALLARLPLPLPPLLSKFPLLYLLLSLCRDSCYVARRFRAYKCVKIQFINL
jgi:hypothetical protein